MEVKKHLILTGSSTVSWKDAIVKTIEETSKSLNYLDEITVLEQRASVSQDKIMVYYVDLDLSFTVDISKIENN